MWKMYVKSGEGIAIQSTVKQLKNSFMDNNNNIYIGSVKYANFSKLSSSIDPYIIMAVPIIFKRKIFQHERELRAIIRKEPKAGSGITVRKPKIEDGIYVPVNLDILINDIYLAPTSPNWQNILLESIIKRYKLNKKVIRSGLDDKP
jgi:hypothetical protein